MRDEVIKRYLLSVRVYVSVDSALTLVQTSEIESDSSSLVNLPPLNIFAENAELSIQVDVIEERSYVERGSMLERVTEDRLN